MVISFNTIEACKGELINNLINQINGILGDLGKFMSKDSIKIYVSKWQKTN